MQTKSHTKPCFSAGMPGVPLCSQSPVYPLGVRNGGPWSTLLLRVSTCKAGRGKGRQNLERVEPVFFSGVNAESMEGLEDRRPSPAP